MNICIFSDWLEEEHKHKKVGGVERHVSTLVKGLLKRGHDITIITSKHPRGIEKKQYKKLKIFYTQIEIKRNPLSNFRHFKEAINIFKKINVKEKFDIIHTQSDLIWWYLKNVKKTTPTVTTLHRTIINEFKSSIRSKPYLAPFWVFLLPLYHFIGRFYLKKSDKLICVSLILMKDVIKQYRVPKAKIEIIFNGIDIKKFKPKDNSRIKNLRKKYATKQEKIILYIGSLIKQKGCHILIKSFSDILKKEKNLKLVIGGSGPYYKNLKNLIENLRLENKVIFVGKIDSKDTVNYYNIADIFVFPTLRIESFGLVSAEAMSCGKPVIASKIGAISDVITNFKDGILVKPNNLEELRKNILKVLNNKTLVKRLSENARKKIVNNFNIDKMIDETIKVYDGLLEKQKTI